MYKQQILTQIYKSPDYSDECPICGGKDCAVKIGFYYRDAYSHEEGKLIESVPIQRYLCRRKGNIEDPAAHRTFSLLLYPLIPYGKYDINTTCYMAGKRHRDKMTLLNIAMEMMGHFNLMDFPVANVVRYLKVFEIARLKFRLFVKKLKNTIAEDFLDVPQHKLKSRTMYYYCKQADFLFGVPSQGSTCIPPA